MNFKGRETDLEVPLRPELESIMQKYHDSTGYPGINAIINSTQQRYTWAGIYSDTASYVSNVYSMLRISLHFNKMYLTKKYLWILYDGISLNRKRHAIAAR